MIDKSVPSVEAAVADIGDGATVMIGGFGTAGMPVELVDALIAQGARDLTIVNNNAGNADTGLAALIREKRMRKIICSFPRQTDSWHFEKAWREGELELELVPQGTLAEKLRAGGSGIAAFWTQTGVGTFVAEGGMPLRYDGAGGIALASVAKEVREFVVRGVAREYVLEDAIGTDFALVHAERGDRYGNLVFHRSARNFSPLAAMAGRVAIAQVEHLVEPGEIDPDDVHLPGVYVHRVVEVGPDVPKRIEKLRVRTPAEPNQEA